MLKKCTIAEWGKAEVRLLVLLGRVTHGETFGSAPDQVTPPSGMSAMPPQRLHLVTIEALADLAASLAAVKAMPDDPVLVVLPDGTYILGARKDLERAARGFEGDICLAASPVAFGTAAM